MQTYTLILIASTHINLCNIIIILCTLLLYYFSVVGNIKDLGAFCTCVHYNNTMLHTIPYNVILIIHDQIIAIA